MTNAGAEGACVEFPGNAEEGTIGFEVVAEVVNERPQKGGDTGAGLSTLGENRRPPSPVLCVHLKQSHCFHPAAQQLPLVAGL